MSHLPRRRRGVALAICYLVFAMLACARTASEGVDSDGRLAACSGRPNCVCSDDDRERHAIAPYLLAGSPEAAWEGLAEALTEEERTTVVERTGDYLHAEARSRLFRFVDDVEFHLRVDENLIAVRSAARTGYSDRGVNRDRIERIRARLVAAGLVD